MEDMRMSLINHLDELRKRVIIISLAIIVGSLVSYAYIDLIIDLIVKPAKNLEFIYLSPPELFLAYVKISLAVGAMIASPIVLVQIWLFIKPGLKKRERKYLLFALFMGIVFFAMGTSFAYFIIIPMTIDFFVKMAVDGIAPLFSFANYISFCSSLLFSFGLVFQLPLLIILLSQLNLVSSKTFKGYRKIFVLLIFIVAAVLTPPDVVSQVLMAGPMILLYEFSVMIAVIIEKRRRKKKK
ncbi:Sec-independent protein translocase, TatC subunit [Alkaliphilus metalliredigens QYMF]|uniref:Sec-independent protein translocase protein TatC n=1 Tax=Alkaliphilus metalliredigens (strain QYMF) TaxID=293826 RepID=A6TLZ8_ALKMQ|nr:twin-arginine translocase subunit TatC [Alkaliphilus metalliredigens]ABR47216.1 Sec-independent protein translocase, TatC subunit [Alkaliphilus metalliredigens QYMF]